MAKKTQRRAAARQQRDQLGCMWGFMNMFTFRHGPLAHKLLGKPFMSLAAFFGFVKEFLFCFVLVNSYVNCSVAAGNPRNSELDKDAQETHVSFNLI